MQLSFLGKPYTAFTPAVEVLETRETATFLGRSYTRKQYTVAARSGQPSELTYRGIAYNR